MAGWWFLFWIMILNSERAMCQPDLSSLVEKSRWRNLRNTSLMLMVCDGGQRSGCGSLPTCPLNLYQAASPPPKVAVLVSTFDFNFKLDFNRNLIFVDSNFCPRNTFSGNQTFRHPSWRELFQNSDSVKHFLFVVSIESESSSPCLASVMKSWVVRPVISDPRMFILAGIKHRHSVTRKTQNYPRHLSIPPSQHDGGRSGLGDQHRRCYNPALWEPP